MPDHERYPVTQHALIRYLERVMNVDMTPYRAAVGADPDPALILAEFSARTGVCLEWLRRRVLPPELLPALEWGGAAKVRCNGYACVIENGQVVTVLTNDRSRGARIYSKAECRRVRRRFERRVR